MFVQNNFICKYLNQSRTPNIFAYITDDAVTTVTASNYFNSISSLLKKNDLIELTSTSDDVITFLKVTDVANKVVTVADGTDIA